MAKTHLIIDSNNEDGTHSKRTDEEVYCGKIVNENSIEYTWLVHAEYYIRSQQFWCNIKEMPICKACIENIPDLTYLKYLKV